MKERILFCWSGGKDSALALYRLMQDDRREVVALLTTCNAHFERVSMHGTPLRLSELQAERIGLPLDKVFVSERSSNEEYSLKMAERMLEYKQRGVTTVAFGDIFLEDLRAWREGNLTQIGMRAIFPLWKNDTRALVSEFAALGFRSRICCADAKYFDASALGRDVDEAFVESLPPGVDPCTGAVCPKINAKSGSSSPCRPVWIRAARTASSIHSRMRDRSSASRCGFAPASGCSAMGFGFAICYRGMRKSSERPKTANAITKLTTV